MVRNIRVAILILMVAAAAVATAQTPTGVVAGVVRDPSGAAVPNAQVKLTNLATGLTQEASTSAEGDYSFFALPVGEYHLSAETLGFKRIVHRVTIEAGATTTQDIALAVGETTDAVTVEGASPQMRYDAHTVGGVVTQGQIQGLPLNGRSILDLARLEPGVQAPTRASSNRLFVPALGQPQGNNGRGTRVTVDGGSIMAVGNGGSAMGFSQEVVQEFQIATVNFDLTTGLTNGAAINVVTRSGGNELRGTAFLFFRDHNLAAYPTLNRDPTNPDPFFQRRQFGVAVGGPIRRDRVFFFGNYERNEQRGVRATTILAPEFAHLNRITASPYFGNQLSVRLDARLTERDTGFVRYSHDGVRAFGPVTLSPGSYPSFWTRQPLWADQSILGLTRIFSDKLVNDFRFSYLYVNASQTGPTQRECPGCLGVGGPSITVAQVGVSIGTATDQYTLSRRYHLTDYLTWQRDTHRVRFGVDWEHNRGGAFVLPNERTALTLFSPQQARQTGIPVPTSYGTVDDILRLPLQSVSVGIGEARVPQAGGGSVRKWNSLRLFFQDTWRLHPQLTVNYGLGWNVDRNLNYDLTKPELLAPIVGPDGLGPTRRDWNDFSPVLGFAWVPERRTIVRGGAGLFYDFLFAPYLDGERALLSAPGAGGHFISGDLIANCLSGIPGVLPGAPLNFPNTPTRFTGADLMTCLPKIRADLERDLASTDQSIKAIQFTKQAAGLSPANLPNISALHVNVGIQREVARNFVVTADFAYRHFNHVGLGQPDVNHFNSARGPVIPRCTEGQRIDPHALCSNNSIGLQANVGRVSYKGLLVRADKRMSDGFQLLGSWAYSSNTGTEVGNGFNLDDWLGNRGPLERDVTHIVNLAGLVHLPRDFHLGFNFSYSSAQPFSAFVGGSDFNGDGTTNDLLPGTTVNAFNRGMGPADLERLVAQFNQTHAGKPDGKGRTIPRLALPDSYRFNDNFQSLDVRLSREFVIERWRVILIGEAFNVFNASNLTGFSGNLFNRSAFGQATDRATQVFGSGGSRAFQLAVRVSF